MYGEQLEAANGSRRVAERIPHPSLKNVMCAHEPRSSREPRGDMARGLAYLRTRLGGALA